MNPERLYTVLVEPHITEKATNLGESSNHYAFKVAKDATKAEIKEAVETLFAVNVEGVTTLNVKGKVKRNFRGVTSRMKSWKKAYVRIAEGQMIDYTATPDR
jgi:large subunit ribosomal protein L23